MDRRSDRKSFNPPHELLFLVKTSEHKEVEYEVWAHDSSEAIKNLKRGHGFRRVLSEQRDILEVAPQE